MSLIRGRLAPSPTGALHLGNAQSFLIAWLSARSQGGQIIMRLEDLEHPKTKPETAAQAYEDLLWLGLDWDEGPELGGSYAPYCQSQRLDLYQAALNKLIDAELAYPCTCSRQDIRSANRAPHADEASPKYPGTCRNRFNSYQEALSQLPEGRIPAWRFRTSPGKTEYFDKHEKQQVLDVFSHNGDFIIARHPQGAGYQLAVVVDDAAMRITEVVRGNDLLESTHWQILLYQALDLPIPQFTHLPLITGEDKRRLAKRHGDTRIQTIRKAGTKPEKVIGLLAYWCGWAKYGELLDPHALLERFTLSTIPKNDIILEAKDKKMLGLNIF